MTDVTITDQDEVVPDATISPARQASMASGAVGGAASAYSMFEAGKTSQSLARFNANYARMQADQAVQAGGFAAARRQVVANQLTGRTVAEQGASGTVAGAGTNRAVTASQDAGTASDKYLLEVNASRQSNAMQVRAAGDDFTGQQDRSAGEMAAMSTLLNTGSNEWLESDPTWDPRFGRGVATQGH